jgi:3D (Asp-Asp-Asp) domain-containing protein
MMTPTEPSRAAESADAGPSEAETTPIFVPDPAPREVGGFLSLVLGRIMRGIKGMVPLVFALSCQSVEPPAAPPRPEPAAEPQPAPNVSVAEEPLVPPETGPRQLGKFNITFYYVVGEEEIVARPSRKKPPVNDNVAAAGTPGAKGGEGGEGGEAGSGSDKEFAAVAPPDPPDPPEKYTLYGPGKGCEPIAETTREFVSELTMQGTGKLRDGRLVNIWGPCKCPNSPCFHVVEQQWGIGGGGRPLQPFRSVAVDPKLIKLGSLLYVPLLEGRTMPGRPPWGGFVHDGCVIADDTGGAVRNYQLDLFVGRRGWFLGMSGHPGPHSWARQIPVFDGAKVCERKGRKISRKSGSI